MSPRLYFFGQDEIAIIFFEPVATCGTQPYYTIRGDCHAK